MKISGFKRIVEGAAGDLEKRLPTQRATQRRKLSELVGEIYQLIHCKGTSCNL
ncbi:MAG: hypothetical protein H0X26_10065 [Alphaproteobacteria bacterium]|nr:hypothetical protein [Alphaproteobacteria bacterium]